MLILFFLIGVILELIFGFIIVIFFLYLDVNYFKRFFFLIFNFFFYFFMYQVKGFNFLQKIGDCEYFFVWEIEAVCLIVDTNIEGKNCSIKDRNFDYTFDFSFLRKSGD